MKRYIVESSGESEGSVENENNQFQLNAETIARWYLFKLTKVKLYI